MKEDTNPSPLDYAARLPHDTRTSKLAIISLVMALLACPFLLGPLSDWINWYVPPEFKQAGRYGDVHQWTIVGANILAPALSLIAVIRIRLSRGRLLGARVARGALVLSLLWWALPIGIILIFWWSGDSWLR